MSDNQSTIEALHRLQDYFEAEGFYLSASKVRGEIEQLQPKPKYEVGKAYSLWSAYREDLYDAIYVGGELPWARYDDQHQAIRNGSLQADTFVVDTEKKEILVTEEDFQNAPWNTIVRRKDHEESSWDVAVVNRAGSWYVDGYVEPHEAHDMAKAGSWEVISRG